MSGAAYEGVNVDLSQQVGWNASTDSPIYKIVNSSLAESDDNINVLRLRSKLYEWNKDSNRFVNLNDPGNQLTKEEMVQVADALRGGVEETCVEVVKRKQNMKRMSTVEMLYNQEKAKPIPQSSKQDKSIWCGFC
eukprot:GHVT01045841.1.p1 GENE.GHVT01045841.1~~GHVT01045841.1.p1  ORF type:complete len:135 (-),score=13.83 GHVT01045841.1:283-687(-)